MGSMTNHDSMNMDMGVYQLAFAFVPLFDLSSAIWNRMATTDVVPDISSYWSKTIVMEFISSATAIAQIVLDLLGLDTMMICMGGKSLQVLLEIVNISLIIRSERKDGTTMDWSTKYSVSAHFLSFVISTMATMSMMGKKDDPMPMM